MFSNQLICAGLNTVVTPNESYFLTVELCIPVCFHRFCCQNIYRSNIIYGNRKFCCQNTYRSNIIYGNRKLCCQNMYRSNTIYGNTTTTVVPRWRNDGKRELKKVISNIGTNIRFKTCFSHNSTQKAPLDLIPEPIGRKFHVDSEFNVTTWF